MTKQRESTIHTQRLLIIAAIRAKANPIRTFQKFSKGSSAGGFRDRIYPTEKTYENLAQS